MTDIDSAKAPPVLSADEIALFLDIDGTLIEHHPRPDGVFVDEKLRELLTAANARLDGAVAFVTGRMIEHVDRLFDPLKLPIAGVFGQEIRLTHHGKVETVADEQALQPLTDAVFRQFGGVEGVHFERKGSVLAIHTRAATHLLEEIVDAVRTELGKMDDKYFVMVGNAGLEILPVGALKSDAIESFMAIEPFASRTPVFVGDDVSDESGFRFVNKVGGVSVRVFPKGETEATFILQNVSATRAWLATLLA